MFYKWEKTPMSNEISRGPDPLRGSVVERIPGRRSVKEYAVSEETLDTMSAVSAGSSLFVAIASGAGSYAGSIYLSLSTASTDMPVVGREVLEMMMKVAGGVSIFFVCLAAVFIFKQTSMVRRIKRETVHEN